jgi:lysophospholipase L1-like esterase
MPAFLSTLNGIVSFFNSHLFGVKLFVFISCLILIIWITLQFALKKDFRNYKAMYQNLFLFLFALSCVFIGIESLLKYIESGINTFLNNKTQPTIANTLVMPKELQDKEVEIEGSDRSYYWQGKLHVHKYEGFRRSLPFPEKTKDTLRIMVVGDSLTYRYGINKQDTYSSLIQKTLSEKYYVEVLNLGVSGYQSEDVYKLIKKYLPMLQPDLILYGMCLNDFLPSGIGEYQNNQAYKVPFPLKDMFIKRTRAGKFLVDRYNRLLINLKLRDDFFSDILKDFKNYQTRFKKDMHVMNQFVKSKGLPPIIGMVIHQYPCDNCEGYQIAKVAEKYMRDAELTAISTDYIEELAGRDIQLHVNKWEGHPNEKANQIFAEKFLQEILKLPWIVRYKKVDGI